MVRSSSTTTTPTTIAMIAPVLTILSFGFPSVIVSYPLYWAKKRSHQIGLPDCCHPAQRVLECVRINTGSCRKRLRCSVPPDDRLSPDTLYRRDADEDEACVSGEIGRASCRERV